MQSDHQQVEIMAAEEASVSAVDQTSMELIQDNNNNNQIHKTDEEDDDDWGFPNEKKK